MFSYNPVDVFGRTVIPFGFQHMANVPSLPLIGSFFPQMTANVSHPYSQVALGVNPALCGTLPVVDPRVVNTLDPRFCGTIDPRVVNTLDPRLCGTIDPRVVNTLDPRLCGTIDPRVYGTLPVDIRSLCGVGSAINPLALQCASMIRPSVFGTTIPQVQAPVWGGIPRETVVG